MIYSTGCKIKLNNRTSLSQLHVISQPGQFTGLEYLERKDTELQAVINRRMEKKIEYKKSGINISTKI